MQPWSSLSRANWDLPILLFNFHLSQKFSSCDLFFHPSSVISENTLVSLELHESQKNLHFWIPAVFTSQGKEARKEQEPLLARDAANPDFCECLRTMLRGVDREGQINVQSCCLLPKGIGRKEWLELSKRWLSRHLGEGRVHLRSIEMFFRSVDVFEPPHFWRVLVSSIFSLFLYLSPKMGRIMCVCCYGNFYVRLLQGCMLDCLLTQKYSWCSPKAVGNISVQTCSLTIAMFWEVKRKQYPQTLASSSIYESFTSNTRSIVPGQLVLCNIAC